MKLRTKHHLLSLSVFLLTAGPACASSMPQMNKASFPNQLLWLAISFVLLYIIVSTVIAPRLRGVFDTREAAINDAIVKAEALKATATDARSDFEQAGRDARAKAAQLIAEAQAKAAKKAAEAQHQLAGELAEKSLAAEKAIHAASAKAQGGIEAAATSLAVAMSEKLLGTKVDSSTAKGAVSPLLKAS